MAELLTNKQFAESNAEFQAACEKAGIKPTARQASKFRNRHGAAWDAWLKLRGASDSPIDSE